MIVSHSKLLQISYTISAPKPDASLQLLSLSILIYVNVYGSVAIPIRQAFSSLYKLREDFEKSPK